MIYTMHLNIQNGDLRFPINYVTRKIIKYINVQYFIIKICFQFTSYMEGFNIFGPFKESFTSLLNTDKFWVNLQN